MANSGLSGRGDTKKPKSRLLVQTALDARDEMDLVMSLSAWVYDQLDTAAGSSPFLHTLVFSWPHRDS